MIKVKERVAGAIAGATLLLSVIAVHVNTQTDIARMTERVDNLHTTNAQTLQVLSRLADSVDKLSNSVARLDERTKVLEREDRRD